MFYLDTSVIVAALTSEPHSERVIAWMAERPEGSLYVSEWCDTEVSSALALKNFAPERFPSKSVPRRWQCGAAGVIGC